MFHQLKKIWPAKSDKEINAMMGTTPMIGYNDVQGEVFYQSDAKLVMEDAVKRDLGMVGIWSMARDQPGIAKQVSPEHSGMTEQQAPMYAYSKIFAPFTHDDAKTNCCHRWGENDRKGAIGDIYLSDDFYGQGKAYFNLMGTGSDGKYWYYPATKSNNRYWIYLGDTEEQTIANNQELMKYHRWGENSGKGKIGDVYLSNPDSTHLALYKLIALNSDQTYGYYPRYKESNQYWEYVGDVTLNLK